MIQQTELQFVQKDTWEFDINITDGSESYQLQEGDNVWFAMKKNLSDQQCVLHIEQPSTHFKILPSQTDLAPGRYVFDMGITFANGDVITIIAKSKLTVYEKVCRDDHG